jgi:hypothetical protein
MADLFEEIWDIMIKKDDWDDNHTEEIIYTCLEDINFHTFNYLFVAYLYGTYEEIKKATEIMLEHEKIGHALPENLDWLQNNLGEYAYQLWHERKYEKLTGKVYKSKKKIMTPEHEDDDD